MTTQKQIRSAFWLANPQFKRVAKKTQNGYCADIRQAFCDFVESLSRNGEISDSLANRATL